MHVRGMLPRVTTRRVELAMFLVVVTALTAHGVVTTLDPVPLQRSTGGDMFGEATIASAMIDRIVHHADVIVLKGTSYRIKHTAIASLPSVAADREADSTT